MSRYTADIGTWERGKNVDLPNSTTLKEAINEAFKICETAVFDPPIESPDVVQIKENGQIVWDAWNGSFEDVLNSR